MKNKEPDVPRPIVDLSKCFRAAIIGCGRIASTLEEDPLREKPCTHTATVVYSPDFYIVGACDINDRRLRNFARQWNKPDAILYTDYRKMLVETRPDMICVATWTGTHAEIVTAAAEHGVRAIFCEKPLGVNVAEGEKMVAACRAHNVFLAVNHSRRWQWQYRNARDLVRSGELGEVRSVNGNVLTGRPPTDWHSDPALAGAGPLMHDGTHLVDAIRFITGEEIVAVRGHIQRDAPNMVEHTALAWLRFGNGAQGFIEAGGRRGYFHFEIDIHFSKGRLVIGNGFQRVYAVKQSTQYSGFHDLVEIPFPEHDKQQYYMRAMRELAAVLRGATAVALASTGADGLAVLKTIDAIYRSAEKDGERIVL